MNSILTDNKVSTLQDYMLAELSYLYSAREAGNITSELFYHFKRWSRADIVMNLQSRISESEILKFHFAIKRLKTGEPLQYITGKTWFCGLELEVNPSVLIPRPETEELVQLVMNKNSLQNPKILDIGTGSGCISIALKKKIPGAHITACDISEDALAVAKRNALLHHTEINFHHLNILQESPPNQTWDIIVSNPPYVLESDKAQMTRQVLEHEPHTALFVPDDDALMFYKRIIELGKIQLVPGGMICCEIHEQAEAALTAELKKSDMNDFEFIRDMQGKVRVLMMKF